MGNNICGGSQEYINIRVGQITKDRDKFFFLGTVSQVFSTIGMRPKFMVRSKKTVTRSSTNLVDQSSGTSGILSQISSPSIYMSTSAGESL